MVRTIANPHQKRLNQIMISKWKEEEEEEEEEEEQFKRAHEWQMRLR